MMLQAFSGAQVFDGHSLRAGVVVVQDGVVLNIVETVPFGATEIPLPGGILAPGLIDLQVNGGGGQMVDGTTTAADLAAICATHARLGSTGIMPTLITDTDAATDRVIAAGIKAKGTPGFLGLHLEGPHLDPRRKGAHDAALIRPMQAADVDKLCRAARALPALMVTLAPASATPDQISALAKAGVIVSLGHSECTLAEARQAIEAGALCATHLFNAMSQIGHREPGLSGAVLTSHLACGLIADGIHVHPQAMQLALAAKPDGVFLVSDCMAVAGTDLVEFTLAGRKILRRDGRLTLADGTLAGADLTLPRAMAVLAGEVGVPLPRVLAMATRIPADLIGRPDLGRIQPGGAATFVHLTDDLSLRAVWTAGQKLA